MCDLQEAIAQLVELRLRTSACCLPVPFKWAEVQGNAPQRPFQCGTNNCFPPVHLGTREQRAWPQHPVTARRGDRATWSGANSNSAVHSPGRTTNSNNQNKLCAMPHGRKGKAGTSDLTANSGVLGRAATVDVIFDIESCRHFGVVPPNVPHCMWCFCRVSLHRRQARCGCGPSVC